MDDADSYSGESVYRLKMLCLQRRLGNWGGEPELLGRLRHHDLQQCPDPQWSADSDPSGAKWRQQVDEKYQKLIRESDALAATEVNYYKRQLQAAENAGEERKARNYDRWGAAYRGHEHTIPGLKMEKEPWADQKQQTHHVRDVLNLNCPDTTPYSVVAPVSFYEIIINIVSNLTCISIVPIHN